MEIAQIQIKNNGRIGSPIHPFPKGRGLLGQKVKVIKQNRLVLVVGLITNMDFNSSWNININDNIHRIYGI